MFVYGVRAFTLLSYKAKLKIIVKYYLFIVAILLQKNIDYEKDIIKLLIHHEYAETDNSFLPLHLTYMLYKLFFFFISRLFISILVLTCHKNSLYFFQTRVLGGGLYRSI